MSDQPKTHKIAISCTAGTFIPNVQDEDLIQARIIDALDSLSAEKDKQIERLKAAPKVSITADAKAVVWSEERLSNYRSEMGKVRDILVHYASLPPFEDGKVRLKMGCGKALEGIAIINQMIGEE